VLLDAQVLVVLGVVHEAHHHTDAAQFGRYLVARHNFIAVAGHIVGSRSAEVAVSYHGLAIGLCRTDGVNEWGDSIHAATARIHIQ